MYTMYTISYTKNQFFTLILEGLFLYQKFLHKLLSFIFKNPLKF